MQQTFLCLPVLNSWNSSWSRAIALVSRMKQITHERELDLENVADNVKTVRHFLLDCSWRFWPPLPSRTCICSISLVKTASLKCFQDYWHLTLASWHHGLSLLYFERHSRSFPTAFRCLSRGRAPHKRSVSVSCPAPPAIYLSDLGSTFFPSIYHVKGRIWGKPRDSQPG